MNFLRETRKVKLSSDDLLSRQTVYQHAVRKLSLQSETKNLAPFIQMQIFVFRKITQFPTDAQSVGGRRMSFLC